MGRYEWRTSQLPSMDRLWPAPECRPARQGQPLPSGSRREPGRGPHDPMAQHRGHRGGDSSARVGGSGWESNPPLRGSARSRTALKAAQVTRPESLPRRPQAQHIAPDRATPVPPGASLGPRTDIYSQAFQNQFASTPYPSPEGRHDPGAGEPARVSRDAPSREGGAGHRGASAIVDSRR